MGLAFRWYAVKLIMSGLLPGSAKRILDWRVVFDPPHVSLRKKERVNVNLSRGAQRLLSFLQSKKNTAGESWWSLPRMATALGDYNERSVRRWAVELREAGELVWKRRGSTSNMFVLTGQNVRTEWTKCPNVSIELNLKTEKKPAALAVSASGEMPPYQVPNEFGRMIVNPEYARIRDVLHAADDRIRRARDPGAYARAIIARERAS